MPQCKKNTVRLFSRQRRGMAMVAVMLMLMLLLAITLMGMTYNIGGNGGVAGRADTHARSGRKRVAFYGAQNLAETGLRATMQWMSEQPIAPILLSARAPWNFYPEAGTRYSGNWAIVPFDEQGGSGNNFKVRIYPCTLNVDIVNVRKSYVIESVGTWQGSQQTIRAVVTQDTFAKFAYFIDNVSLNWWVAGNTSFNGPVHVNAASGGAVNILWNNTGSSSTTRIFNYNASNAFTTAAPSINWNLLSVGNVRAPVTTTEWSKVAKAGAAAIRTNINPITMPSSSDMQHDAALGATPAPSPTDIGAIVPNAGGAANAGIYITGDVDDMTLNATRPTGSSAYTTQVITINQSNVLLGKSIRSTITIDPVANTTNIQRETRSILGIGSWVTDPSRSTTYSGIPNGVVYASGNIGGQAAVKTGGVSGWVADNVMNGAVITRANSLSIVTATDKDLNIDGDVRYHDTNTATVATAKSGTLGIISRHISVTQSLTDLSGLLSSNCTVHATCLAYDTFDVEGAYTRPVGSFTILGGYIAKNSGVFGAFNSVTGSIATGFVRNMNYDTRAASTPPPFFPVTDRQFVITSYQRVTSTLQP